MFKPIKFNKDVCDGCNICVQICPMDVFEANSVKGATPIVKYPDECYYDGACWEQCPKRDNGAITVIPPLPMRVSILKGE